MYSQVLKCILLRLDPPERLQKALICRQWAEFVSRGALLDDIWLDFYGSEKDRAVDTFIRSQRHYRNLRLFRGNLTMTGRSRPSRTIHHAKPFLAVDLTRFDPEFWTKVGRHLHRLELAECTLPGVVFYKILRSCPQLRSLELKGKRGSLL